MAQQIGSAAVVGSPFIWLRRVVAAKIVVTVAFWGLPFLLAPLPLLKTLGMVVPAAEGALVALRGLGSLSLALGVLYWHAYRDPARNVAILRFGVVANGLTAVTFAVLGFTVGIPVLAWLSAALMLFFAVSFAVLMPKE